MRIRSVKLADVEGRRSVGAWRWGGGATSERGAGRTAPSRVVGAAGGKAVAAGALATALFLFLTIPALPAGPVVGTGQDEFYNVIRALHALYDGLNPDYFIHPALYYELLASVYWVQRALLWLGGGSARSDFLTYFVAHQSALLDLARLVSVGGGVVAVLAGVGLGTVLSGPGGGLLSGLLVASLPLLQVLAGSIRVDTVALAAWLGAAALLARYAQRPGRPALVAAASGIGIAAAANYPGALLLIPLAWLEWLRGGAEPARARALRCAAAAAIAFGVFLALNPYALIDLPVFLRWFAFQAGVALTTHPHADAPSAGRYLELLRDQGAPAAVACAAGAAACLRPGRPSGALAMLAVLYLAGFSAMQSQYDRFALPVIALLAVTGVAWCVGQVNARCGPRAARALLSAAAILIVGAAAARPPRAVPPAETDYRAEMFAWIGGHVPPSATLVFESDTLPLLQEVYAPGDAGGRFHDALRRAFERAYPTLPRRMLKTQYIAAVYNYDARLLDGGEVFFLASSQNRPYLAAHRAELPAPAAFYDALDARAAVVHEAGGPRESLLLYRVGASAR